MDIFSRMRDGNLSFFRRVPELVVVPLDVYEVPAVLPKYFHEVFGAVSFSDNLHPRP